MQKGETSPRRGEVKGDGRFGVELDARAVFESHLLRFARARVVIGEQKSGKIAKVGEEQGGRGGAGRG